MDNPRTNSNVTLMTMGELKQMSAVFMASGLFPDVDSEAKAIVKIMAGAELGFSPIASMRGVNVFMGRVSLSTDLMAALVKHGGRYTFRAPVNTANECRIEWYDKGILCHQSSFTREEAVQAGLFGKPQKLWEKYPKDMLYARALTRGAKVVCPQKLAGLDLDDSLSAPDEAAEAAIPPTMTNAPGNGHTQTPNGNGHQEPNEAEQEANRKQYAGDGPQPKALLQTTNAETIEQPLKRDPVPIPGKAGERITWILARAKEQDFTPVDVNKMVKEQFMRGGLSSCTDAELLTLAHQFEPKPAAETAPQPAPQPATTPEAETGVPDEAIA